MPLVCICIPTYNAETTIRETLDSILKQTHQNLVVLISDNASTDETLNVIRSFEDSRVHIYINTDNVGGEENFNRCIKLAHGQYTAIFHADDIYEPNMIAQQLNFLKANPNIGAVFTAANRIDAYGNATGMIGWNGDGDGDDIASIYNFPQLMKAVLKDGNFLVCPSAMVRTQIYQNEIYRWRGDMFRSSADLDVWFRIASKHSVAILNAPLMSYRVGEKQFSSSVRKRTERSDFFLVMDYYLAKPEVRVSLSEGDLRNFRQLIANDKLWRSINHFTKGDLSDAKHLIRGTFNLEFLRGGFSSKRGLLMLLVSVALHFMIALKLKKLGQTIINNLRVRLKK